MATETQSLRICDIRIDGGTQARAELNLTTVSEYSAAIEEGAVFPPPVVFYDGTTYWLGDGFHRVRAYVELGREEITCKVRSGTQRDAILYSVGANANHGLPRTNKDKRQAVTILLNDAEWSKRSDNWIAQKCGVSNHMVADVRKTQLGENPSCNTGQLGKDGKVRRKKKKAVKRKPATIAVVEGDEEEPEAEAESESQDDGDIGEWVVVKAPEGFDRDKATDRVLAVVRGLATEWPAEDRQEFCDIVEHLAEELRVL